MSRIALAGMIAIFGVALALFTPRLAVAQDPAPGAPAPTATPTPAPRAMAVCAGAPSDMVCVPAGVFTMGSNIGDADEQPPHRVALSEFLIDKQEVTFGQYMQCVQAQKCGVPRYYPPLGQRKVIGSVTSVIKRLPATRKGAPRPTAPQVIKIKVARIMVDAALPVAGITWHDAKKYCAFRGKHLPTEAQWEYAARGANGNYYAWGGDPPTCERVNSAKCGKGPKATPLPGGVSPFGAFHMTGNVWEWTHDWYDAKFYATSSNAQDPTGPTNLQDPVTGRSTYRHRVLRGGSWSGIPAELRTAYRYRLLPTMYANDIGVRCAKSAVPPSGRVRSAGRRKWASRSTVILR